MGAGQITFGPFVLDRAAQALLSGGRPISLGQRGYALLDALAGADGNVSKAALIEAAWPGTIVEEGNLTVQIAALRKALGTRPDGSEWIVTVPRVGYRLVRETISGVESPPLGLPTLAVLPFQNLSGDAEQDYFADGIVEDIITGLSRFKSFAVVSRNSSFVYKGRAVDVRDVARDLSVQYVLEGSVRRAGNRLRVSAKLVEGGNAVQMWGKTFDGTVEDVFDMQDGITESVIAVVEPQLQRAEIERMRDRRPESLSVYELYLQALPNVYATWPQENARGIHLLERALTIDPAYPPALAMIGMSYLLRVGMQLDGVEADDVEKAIDYARRALATGSVDPLVIATAGFVLLETGHFYEEGLALLRRAVADNPNNSTILTMGGVGHLLGGNLDEGERLLLRGLRLNPNEYGAHWIITGLAHIRMAQGRYEEALDFATRSLGLNTRYDATYWMLIAACALLGRIDEAKVHLAGLMAVSPGVTISRVRRGQQARDPHRIDVLIDGLRLAGLPE